MSIAWRPLRQGWGYALLVVALTGPRVQAAPSSVEISPPACEESAFALVPFLDALRVELAGRGQPCCALVEPGADTTTALRVNIEMVACAADAQDVQISVEGPDDSRVSRQISLADVAQTARPRALALAVAELIRSHTEGEPAVPRAVPPPQPTPAPPPAPAQPRWSVRAESEARVLPAHDTVMWGGRVGLAVPWRLWHGDLDVGGDWASARAERGQVLLRSASLGLGLGPRLASEKLIVDVGVRAELGWSWIRGESEIAGVRTSAGSDLVTSLGFRASVQAPAQTRVRPTLAVEAGGVLRGVRADVNGQPVLGMTGYYLLAALGVALSP